MSPTERYLRLMYLIGDRYEASVANVVGAERARKLRALQNGWAHHQTTAGCPAQD